VSEAKKDDYRFSALLMGIVQSAPFQMRLSQNIDSQAQHRSATNMTGKEN
jgi:hypothetical protein